MSGENAQRRKAYRELIKRGLSVDAIAKEVGTNASAVYSDLEEVGLPTPTATRIAARRKSVVRMRNRRMTLHAIAQELAVSMCTVSMDAIAMQSKKPRSEKSLAPKVRCPIEEVAARHTTIETLAKAGMSSADIATRMGLPLKIIESYQGGIGLQSVETSKRRKRVRSLLQHDLSVQEIAKRLGVKVATIESDLVAMGMQSDGGAQ